MSVLDAGAACGHALGVLQEVHRGRLHAVGVDGSKASVKYARRETQGSFCVGDVRQARYTRYSRYNRHSRYSRYACGGRLLKRLSQMLRTGTYVGVTVD